MVVPLEKCCGLQCEHTDCIRDKAKNICRSSTIWQDPEVLQELARA